MSFGWVIAGCVGFLLGSIPFALIVTRRFGLDDPRSYGSGNPGATNVMRSGNKLAGRLVFLLDFIKGTLPVVVAMLIWGEGAAAAAACCAVAGHVWSPWLGFKGGKGVATSFGVLLALDWRLCLLAAGIFLLLYVMFKVVSLAAVISIGTIAVLAVLYIEPDTYIRSAIVTIAFIVVIRHRDNFKRLRTGNELKFEKNKEKPQD